jgi:hypothetical protein
LGKNGSKFDEAIAANDSRAERKKEAIGGTYFGMKRFPLFAPSPI